MANPGDYNTRWLRRRATSGLVNFITGAFSCLEDINQQSHKNARKNACYPDEFKSTF